MAVNYDLNGDGVVDVMDVRYLLKGLSGELTEEEWAEVKVKLENDNPTITDVTNMLNAISREVNANENEPLPMGAKFTSYSQTEDGENGKHITIGNDVDEDMIYNKTYTVTGPVTIE